MTRTVTLLFMLATFVVWSTASVAANVFHDFPAGFTVPSDFREDAKRRNYFDFNSSEFAYIPANAKIMNHQLVEGHLWNFAVAAEPPTNNGDVIIACFAGDLEKEGWSILRRQGTLVAHKVTGAHDWWLSGNGPGGDFRLNLVEVASPGRSLRLEPPQPQVEPTSDDQDLPYLKPLPGSRMEKTVHDQRSFEIRPPNSKETTLALSTATRWYDEPPSVSSYEFAAVYRKALGDAGWDIIRVQVGGDVAITAHYGKSGRDIWLYTHGDGGRQSVNVVDYGAESLASKLKQQLARDGHVALYGIYFDTDSATPRPESDASLRNVLALLKDDHALKLEVQGHTDNTGAPEHNATLSEARAASVKQWLISHGIAAAMLSSKGYGASQPVADNKIPEGRAKNRRVELVKNGA